MATIICLANSRKHSNRCVAGICTDRGIWIRPISDSDDGAVSRSDILVRNSEPGLLDIIKLPLKYRSPKDFGFQPENRLINEGSWRKIGRATPDHILKYCEDDEPLLHNDKNSVPFTRLKSLPRDSWKSLQLIHPGKVTFFFREVDTGMHRNTQCRALFIHRRKDYSLVVTDPVIEARIRAGERIEKDCILTVSLGMPWREGRKSAACYKLVAGVVEL